jgi:hypothetical protein
MLSWRSYYKNTMFILFLVLGCWTICKLKPARDGGGCGEKANLLGQLCAPHHIMTWKTDEATIQ